MGKVTHEPLKKWVQWLRHRPEATEEDLALAEAVSDLLSQVGSFREAFLRERAKSEAVAEKTTEMRKVLEDCYWLFWRYAREEDPNPRDYCCQFCHHFAGRICDFKELGIQPKPNV